MTEEKFKKDVYEAYKLWWMLMHGLTLSDYVNALAMADEERSVCGDYPEGSADDILLTLAGDVEEAGLGGSIWVCEDEFFDTDIYNVGEMECIFSAMLLGETYRKFWQERYGLVAEILRDNSIATQTSAGVLKAYLNTDPDQPGICVMLQPDGYEEEIDVAFVSVYENSEYAREDERPEDVVIMSYGDATTEDYTTKEIIRREDVIAGLGTAAHL